MSIQDKREELVGLIDNIKKHSDHLDTLETIPLLELSVILAKIGQLHEKAAVLKHLYEVGLNLSKSDRVMMESEHLDEIQNRFRAEADSLEATDAEEETVEKEEEDETQQEDTIHPATTVAAEVAEVQELEEPVQEFFTDDVTNEEEIVEEDSTPSVETVDSILNEVKVVPPSNDQDREEEVNQIEEESSLDFVLESSDEEIEIQDEPTPSSEILDSILNEVKEEVVSEESSATESTNLVDEIDESVIEKIENETEFEAAPDINEALSENDKSISNQLQQQPIADLMAAIGLNERYLYANELFNGDMDEFKNAMTMLNEFQSGEEAKAFFENGLRTSYEWEDDNVLAQALFNLVERRFQ